MGMYDSEAVREYFEDIKREQEETEQNENENENNENKEESVCLK